jgi:hypothetical protein
LMGMGVVARREKEEIYRIQMSNISRVLKSCTL